MVFNVATQTKPENEMSANNNDTINWMETMVQNVIEELSFALELNGGNLIEAIKYAKQQSMAGENVYEIALDRMELKS